MKRPSQNKLLFAANIAIGFLVVGCFAPAAGCVEAPRPPNILFILTDDQGWPSLGCYGSKHVPTPHIDNLANNGTRFTAAYVTPQCTPTRGALLTGQHPARTRLWHVIPWYGSPWAPVNEPHFTENLPREAFTIAKALTAKGYATACIGKWHLTSNDDGKYNGLTSGAAKFYGFDTVGANGPGTANEGDKHVSHFTGEAIAFMEANKDRPWFCYLAHHTIHRVVSAPAKLIEKHRQNGAPVEGLYNATYLAALEHLDDSVGRLLAAVDQLGMRDNTLVVFLSDNGGVSYSYDIAPVTTGDGSVKDLKIQRREFDNAPLRGTKGTLYEGGIRVPCLVRWPGVVKPGSVENTPIQVTDWLPTLLDAADAKIPADYPLDGVNIRPLFEGKSIPARPLYWYAPLYDLRWGATPAAALRIGPYKLIEFFGDSFGGDGGYRPGHRIELYDLTQDLSEANNLAASKPDVAQSMTVHLRHYLQSLKAEIPGPNPAYDPSRPFRETTTKPK